MAKKQTVASKKAFDFLKLKELPPKPRHTGLVEFRGSYYSSVSHTYLENLLDDWSDYVDVLKFAGGSMRLLTPANVKKFIKIAHDHHVRVDTGGFIERIIIEGPDAVDKYLEECKSLGFDIVEVSSGFAPIPVEDQIAIVKQISKLGMQPKPEISLISGAGGGTETYGYDEKITDKGLDNMINEASAHLKAGAHMLMIESEGITELPGEPGPEKWRIDVIKKLVKTFGFERLMFEAAEPQVFKWYLKNVSHDANLFIDHSQIVEFTAWKLGLWGDKDLWKDKKAVYRK